MIAEIFKKPENLRTAADKLFVSKNPEIVKTSQKNSTRLKVKKERTLEVEDEPSVFNIKCIQLAELIKSSKFVVVYTGAGISTAASIPDYRGPNGVWTLMKKGQEMCPQDLSDAEPTLTHMSLSGLYKAGKVKHVVSQNCDGLHLRSGLPRSVLSELHGNMYIECCYSCSPYKEYIRLFDVTERTSIHRHTTARCCHICGSNLKDTIVHFGEKGKLASPYRWKEAVRAAKKTDLIICLGSSLKVLKKYSFLWCMDKKPRFRPKLVIVNLQWTPKDDVSTLKINGKCDSVMLKVMELLKYKIPEYKRDHDPIFAVHTPLRIAEIKTTSKKILLVPEHVLKTKLQKKSASLKKNNSINKRLSQKLNNIDFSHLSTLATKKENVISALTAISDQSYPVIRNLLQRKNKSTTYNLNQNCDLCKMVHFCCNQQSSETFPSQRNNSSPSSNVLLDSVHVEDAINLCYKKKTMGNSLVPDFQSSEIAVKIKHICGANLPEHFVIDLEKITCMETVSEAVSQECIKLADNIIVTQPDMNQHSASLNHFYLSCKNKCHGNKKAYSCKENFETCFVLNCVEENSFKPASGSFLQLLDDKSNNFFVSNKFYELQESLDGNLCFKTPSHSHNTDEICQESNQEHGSTAELSCNNSFAFDTKVIDLDHCYCQKSFDIIGPKKNIDLSNNLTAHGLLTLRPGIYQQVYKPAITNAYSQKSKVCSEIEGTIQHCNIPCCGSTKLICHAALPNTNISINCSVFDLTSVAKDSKATHIIGPINMEGDLPTTLSEKKSWCDLQKSVFTVDNIEKLESDFFPSSKKVDKTLVSSSGVNNLQIIDNKHNKRKLTVNSVPGWYGKGLGFKKRRR
ncbi:NAD-dependent protein deacetylase sirtuin-7 [Bulinus truncatus]|nr:NAD-dependent protein deacetylase sirtuin-7 [Bulinus truncatus]